MPYATTKAIQYMIEQPSQSQITLPVNHEKPEPLFGVYTKKCLPFWQQLIEQGMIKLQEMVPHFELLKIKMIFKKR
jgi:molybdopterin-guanine dinucleotide biosynthesis protein A